METIALFPLGMVLFPGVVLPLRVFEPRYRTLMEHLLDQPDGTPREFGMVAIRQGWEVGADGIGALYDVGCTARLRQVARHDDGTYAVVTVGHQRFRIDRIDSTGQPYFQAEIERLPDDIGSPTEARVLAGTVAALYRDHVAALADAQHMEPIDEAELPDDPVLLSSLVGASTPLDLADQQDLLAAPDVLARLRAELRLLKREATMLLRVHAVPIPLADLRVPFGVN